MWKKLPRSKRGCKIGQSAHPQNTSKKSIIHEKNNFTIRICWLPNQYYMIYIIFLKNFMNHIYKVINNVLNFITNIQQYSFSSQGPIITS